MPGSGVRIHALRKNNLFFLVLFFAAVCLSAPSSSVQAQVSSEVNAIICGNGSYINITSPPSDSIVTDSTVIIKGNVLQASQIEVRIDGGYNGIVPIDTSQQTYEAPIQLTAGTHTITLKAIDTCGAADSEVSSVLTYTPAPSNASSGEGVPTIAGGVMIGEPQESIAQEGAGGLLPPSVVETWEGILGWLNITSSDTSSSTAPQLSLIRALTIAAGTYLTTIGLAATALNLIASSAPFKNIPATQRYRAAARISRIVGVLLLLAGFFL